MNKTPALTALSKLRATLRTTLRARHLPFARHTHWLCFALFALLVTREYAAPDPPRSATAVPEAHGDGNYYYAYLRSLAFDGDFDFRNDYALLGDQFHAGVNPTTKRAQNVFTLGPALFWLPFVPVAHVAMKVAPSEPGASKEVDGSESRFQRTALYGSVFAGLLATALGLLLAHRFTDRWLATVAAIGVCLGSPLIWFMLRQPSFSHASDAGAVALFVFVWVQQFGSWAIRRWLTLGALLGLAMLVRPQNVAHALLPLGEFLLLVWPSVRQRDRSALLAALLRGALFVLATAVVFMPLLLIWRSIYGAWTLVPQGSGFLDLHNSRWDATLFSSRSGLFAWHPLLLLACSGLLLLSATRRYPQALRLLGLLGIVVLLLQSYINGAANDWWGGWAFGGRRFLSCSIYFVVGLGALFEFGRKLVVRHPLRFAQLSAALLVLAWALHNGSLMRDYVAFEAVPDLSQPLKPRYEAALKRTLNGVYARVGNPGSWPANLIFAYRADTSPERYDHAAAQDYVENLEGHPVTFGDEWRMGGFEPPSDWLGRRASLARGEKATWIFVLRRAAEVKGSVTLAASVPGTRVRMQIDGEYFFDVRPTTEWRDYAFVMPKSETTSGIVYVHVEQTLPPGTRAFVGWEKALLKVDVPRPEPD